MINWFFEKTMIGFFVFWCAAAFGELWLPWVTWGDRVLCVVIMSGCFFSANHLRAMFELHRIQHVTACLEGRWVGERAGRTRPGFTTT